MSNKSVVLRRIKQPSMAKAIRQYCIACGGGQPVEVRDCVLTRCPLFPYRFGCNPKSAENRLRKHYHVEFLE